MKTMVLEAPVATADELACDCLVIGVNSEAQLGPAATRIDQKGEGWLMRAFEVGVITGKRGDYSLLPTPWNDGPKTVLVVGTGDRDTLDSGVAFEMGGGFIRKLLDRERKQIFVAAEDLVPKEFHASLVSGVIVGSTGQDLYQTNPKSKRPENIQFLGLSETSHVEGQVTGEAMNLTRHLVNEPPNHLFPASFAEHAIDAGNQYGFEVEVWGEERLEKERCHAMLAVGQASTRESKLVILRYRGGDEDSPPICIVGKGVTFDSGGLSLKPSASMTDMKCDMAGAATVLGVVAAAARMKVRRNIYGYCGLVENMIAGNALRLGDVVRTRNGKTVEILNTDAEGRVVLADVLDVAADSKPSAMIDLATLTGACMVALGHDVCGLFTNNSELAKSISEAARSVGEHVWELPMHAFYSEQIRSKVADIKNMGDGRYAGAITAAKFLEEFVRDIPWSHIDIAGPAFSESSKSYRDAGATGAMVRTLITYLRS